MATVTADAKRRNTRSPTHSLREARASDGKTLRARRKRSAEARGTTGTVLLRRLRTELRRAGDPEKAAGMRAYMKSAMPYHGVPAPVLGPIARKVFATVRFESAAAWRSAVLALFRGAIGWALRQYAWTDPNEVRRYVRAHEGQLSPLSRREALKNC
jgi:hypothetical protein